MKKCLTKIAGEWLANILLTSLRDFPIVNFSMKH